MTLFTMPKQRAIDRLKSLLDKHNLANSVFERSINIGNGYISKQLDGKGSIGSDILEKILKKYPDWDIIYIITGERHHPGKQPINGRVSDFNHLLISETDIEYKKQELRQVIDEDLLLKMGPLGEFLLTLRRDVDDLLHKNLN